jgi:hypothetical protein
MQQRLRELLSNDHGEIRPELRGLHEVLAGEAAPHGCCVADRSAAPAILRELAGRPLTHASLDELPAGKTVEHLRSILVATETPPPRDEQMARLERWITGVVPAAVTPTSSRCCTATSSDMSCGGCGAASMALTPHTNRSLPRNGSSGRLSTCSTASPITS